MAKETAKHKALKKDKKYEGSKLDKYLDKKMGYKEGSKKDEEMDKKIFFWLLYYMDAFFDVHPFPLFSFQMACMFFRSYLCCYIRLFF